MENINNFIRKLENDINNTCMYYELVIFNINPNFTW